MLNIEKVLSVSKIEELLNFLKIGGDSSSSVYSVSAVILSIAIILFSGFLLTRLTKLLKLPNVTAYIITGILIGPYVFNLIPAKVIEGTEFLSDIALAFIAFSAGEFFKLKVLKTAGLRIIVVTLFESLMAFILVFILMAFILKIDLSFSLVLAALSSATAPASTIMTIKQTGAKGPYVNTLLEVVALDDVVTLILYSIAISICIGIKNGSDGLTFNQIGLPIIKNFICLLLGFGFGFLLKLLLPKKRTTDNRLIIVIACLFLFCGICTLFNVSPLLGCMAIGMVYTNTSNDDGKLFKQLNYFSPPIMLLFFVRSGMNFNLGAFSGNQSIGGISLIVVALVYFIVRIVGKYTGAFLGEAITKDTKKNRLYLGLGLIPQAGVAIGLAAMGARTFIDAGQGELGSSLNTIILASSVLYELIGPASSKLGLFLSGAMDKNIDQDMPIIESESKEADSNSKIDKLIKQIEEISKTIPEVSIDENEQAFTEAAEEYEYENYNRYRGLIHRK